MKLKWEIIKTGGLPHLSRLPHLPGVPLPHVMPENFLEINRYLAFFVMRHDWQTANNAFSILGLFFRGKTKITETIFQGHTKIVLTSKQTKKIAFTMRKRKETESWMIHGLQSTEVSSSLLLFESTNRQPCPIFFAFISPDFHFF